MPAPVSENVIAYDIWNGMDLIGFAMLRKYKKDGFFVWSYAIDHRYQNRDLGTEALKKLIALLRKEYGVKEIAATYVRGNDHANHVYEKKRIYRNRRRGGRRRPRSEYDLSYGMTGISFHAPKAPAEQKERTLF